MRVTVKSNADAFFKQLDRDTKKLKSDGVRGSIQNDTEYGVYVNFGTSRQEGQHFIEASIPKNEQILEQEYYNLPKWPSDADMIKAHNRALKRIKDESIRPLTPRSEIDPKIHLQDVYYINPSETFKK